MSFVTHVDPVPETTLEDMASWVKLRHTLPEYHDSKDDFIVINGPTKGHDLVIATPLNRLELVKAAQIEGDYDFAVPHEWRVSKEIAFRWEYEWAIWWYPPKGSGEDQSIFGRPMWQTEIEQRVRIRLFDALFTNNKGGA